MDGFHFWRFASTGLWVQLTLHRVQLKQGNVGCWSWMKMNAEERIASNDPWHKLARSHGSHRYHLPYGLQSKSNPKVPGDFIYA